MTPITADARSNRIERLSRRARRLIVIATLGGMPAMFAWSAYWLPTSVPTVLWGPISFVLVGATAIGSFVLYRFVRDRADIDSTRLDERQRQLRDRAWILSYGIVAGAVVAVTAILTVFVLIGGRTIVVDGNVATAIAITVGVLIPIIPVAALAWIEPDPLREDA